PPMASWAGQQGCHAKLLIDRRPVTLFRPSYGASGGGRRKNGVGQASKVAPWEVGAPRFGEVWQAAGGGGRKTGGQGVTACQGWANLLRWRALALPAPRRR